MLDDFRHAIRSLRKQRGWTRKELNRRLQSDISLQTLATYELGTRQCSVTRLVEICVALGVPAAGVDQRRCGGIIDHSPVALQSGGG